MNSESPDNSRRTFIKSLSGIALATGLGFTANDLFAGRRKSTKLTILHTNDTHSQIDPFPPNHPRFPNMGGVARRAAVIKRIREEEENVLLLDSGDIYQGTPYFNMFGGSIEFQMMSQLEYDAATMGNHDFDIGLDGFTRNLPQCNFPFLCANYDFTNTIVDGKTRRYKIFDKSGIRIGVFGLGIDFKGLVDRALYAETKFLHPIDTANEVASILVKNERCDFVICLSHLGYSYADEKRISDISVAKETSGIDLILGGHTHTFLDAPVPYKNIAGKDVLIAQTGFAGIRLGRLDVIFEKDGRSHKSKTSVIQR